MPVTIEPRPVAPPDWKLASDPVSGKVRWELEIFPGESLVVNTLSERHASTIYWRAVVIADRFEGTEQDALRTAPAEIAERLEALAAELRRIDGSETSARRRAAK